MSGEYVNAAGRTIPEKIEGLSVHRRYEGAFARVPDGRKAAPGIPSSPRGRSKVLPSLEAAVEASGLRDGMTISFHHHLRNGDGILCRLLDVIASKGIRNLRLASTSLFKTHAPIVEHIRNGVITRMETGIHGAIGEAVFRGDAKLEAPIVVRSHGGRARAIESGDLHIDVAFVSAPSCDEYGNMNGVLGPSACGALGYPMTDAMYADVVVAITDTLVPYPNHPISISQQYVDFVVEVDRLGDPSGIVSGTTRITRNPLQLLIARNACELMKASGLVRDGFSFQTGAGGISLAAAHYLREYMVEKGIKGSFGSGGITGYFVSMLEDGLLERLLDVQCFDLEAVRSLRENPAHIEMSASMYANPHTKGCVVDRLDIVVLGGAEIDVDFNVNVAVESDGVLRHAVGGHQDTAAGASLTIVVAPLIRGRLNTIVERVLTVTTPGETVDAVVTERGIAINPRNEELRERVRGRGLPLYDIRELQEMGRKLTGVPSSVDFEDEILAVIEYRDGTVLDVARRPRLRRGKQG